MLESLLNVFEEKMMLSVRMLVDQARIELTAMVTAAEEVRQRGEEEREAQRTALDVALAKVHSKPIPGLSRTAASSRKSGKPGGLFPQVLEYLGQEDDIGTLRRLQREFRAQKIQVSREVQEVAYAVGGQRGNALANVERYHGGVWLPVSPMRDPRCIQLILLFNIHTLHTFTKRIAFSHTHPHLPAGPSSECAPSRGTCS